ncbi:MAG: dTMP kinase [Gammaproteobacteria bacterium]
MSGAAQRGRFITLEGGEGTGKSTNIGFVEAQLRAAGVDLVVTREPGGTVLAERIRHILVSHADESLPATAELLLVFAARSVHLENLIRPALAAGRWVLSDRFTDATYAYQGAGRGLDVELIRTLESSVQGQLRPDLTLLLDCDPRVGLARAGERGAADRFEAERLDFFTRVRRGYLARAQGEPRRFRVVDASRPLEAVQQDLSRHIKDFIQLNDK